MSSATPSDIKETAYGVFVQGCWQHHKRIYPDEMIEKEIEEFSEDCSYNWNSLMNWAKDNFRKLADRYNSRTSEEKQLYDFFPGPTPEAINQNEFFPINAIPEKSEIKVIVKNARCMDLSEDDVRQAALKRGWKFSSNGPGVIYDEFVPKGKY